MTENDDVVSTEGAAATGAGSAPDAGATAAGTGRTRTSATSRARRIGGPPVQPGPAGSRGARSTSDDETAEPPAAGVRTSKRSPAAAQDWRPAADEPARRSRAAGQAAEPAPEPASTAGERRSIWVWAPAAALALVAVVFGVLIGVFASRNDSSPGAGTLSAADQSLRERVIAAAKGCVVRVNSYDYRTLDADEVQALKCATGGYRTDFQKTFDGVIKKYGVKLHATQTAQIDLAGIEQVSRDGNRWTILLFGQLTVTNNTTAKSGRVDPLAIKVTMQKVGNSWLIAELGGA